VSYLTAYHLIFVFLVDFFRRNKNTYYSSFGGELYFYLYLFLFLYFLQELYDEINRNEFKLNNLNNSGEDLILHSTTTNTLREKLDSVNTRWNAMMNSLNSRKLG